MKESIWYPGLRWLIVILAVGLAAIPLLVRAQSSEVDVIQYRIQRGETLIGLAKEFMITPDAYRAVQSHNNIRNPRRIPVGETIEIPTRLLRKTPARLIVASFSGPVALETSQGNLAVEKGTAVPAGTLVKTGARAFVSFSGAAGSTVSIPSQSTVRIISAHRYLIDNRLDLEMRIVRGRGTFQPPKLDEVDRYRVSTPVAVSAVRGTVFRVFHDEENERSGTGVLEGTVSLTGVGETRAVEEGFGTISTRAGLAPSEKLLPSPEILEPGRARTAELVTFDITAVPQSSGYRTQIARDAGFLDVIAEEVSETPTASFSDIPNGTLFVRARAIAASGLEGYADAYSFRRQRLGVSASVEQDPLSDGFRFAWEQQGEGQALFNFRLWPEGREELPTVAETGMDQRELTLTDMEPGVYFWQVGAVIVEDGDVIEAWGSPQKLIVSN